MVMTILMQEDTYLGVFSPNETQRTISNAMDVSIPNNFPRIEKIFENNFKKKKNFLKISKDPNIKNLEKEISEKIGLNVSINNNKKNKGTITFSYQDIEQLNKIVEIVKKNY